MTTSRDKPLSDWTEAEIYGVLKVDAPRIVHSVNSLVAELDRRRTHRLAKTATIATIAAAVAAIAAAFAAFASLLKS